MRITGAGTFPLNQIAKAYGIKAPPAAQPSLPAVHPARPDTFQPSTKPSSAVQGLVAARVSQPMNFDAAPLTAASRPQSPGVYQMYTRAADKIEAAVAVQIGRALDLQI